MRIILNKYIVFFFYESGKRNKFLKSVFRQFSKHVFRQGFKKCIFMKLASVPSLSV